MGYRKHWRIALIVLIIGMMSFTMAGVLAESNDEPDVYRWDGRGTDSLDCSKYGDEGGIHWVFSTKGDSTDAELVLGGTGSGTYSPGEPLEANVWHFYTPYYELVGLTATINLYGGEPGDGDWQGKGGGLVISDFCPGIEKETGCLKVVKQWKGNYDKADLPDKVEVKVYSDEDKTELVTTLTLNKANGWKDKDCDLAPGTYYVEEIDVEGFSTSYSPGDSIKVKADITACITITNTYIEEFGCLKVEKSWDNDEFAPEKVIVDVYSDAGLGAADKVGEITLTAAGGWEGSLCSLEFGTYYVAERPVESYTTSYPGSNSANVTAGEEAGAVVIQIENILETGSIQLEKVVQDPAGNTLVSQPDTSFTVNVSNNLPVNHPSYYNRNHTINPSNEKKLLTGLPVGYMYTITEVSIPVGYVEVGINPSTVMPNNESVQLITVTNRETKPDTGSITVVKVLEGNNLEETDRSVLFTVLVKGNGLPDDGKEVKFSVNNAGSLSGLTLGEVYSIEEAGHEDFTFVSISTNAVTLTEEEQTVTITVTNRKEEPPTGSIRLEKVVQDAAGITLHLQPNVGFFINVSNNLPSDHADYYNKTFTVVPSQEPVLVNELPLGYTYTITEVDIPAGYELVDIDPATVTPGDDTVKLVTVTNKEKTGAMRIQKSLQNALPGDEDVEFTARLVGPGIDEVITFSVSKPYVLDGLKMGNYTVSEINVPDGFTLVSQEEETVNITAENIDTIQVVTITNSRPTNGNGDDPVRGSLTVRKAFVGDVSPDAADNAKTFTINVTGPRNFYNQRFSVNASWFWSGLPLGEYTIEEIDVPEGYVLVSEAQTVTLTETQPHQAVTVENRIEPEPEPGPEPTAPVVIIEEPELPAVELPVVEEPELPAVEPPVVEEPEPVIVEEPEMIIEVPVAPELPRTGGMNTLLSGFGTLLAGAGALLLQRKRKLK